MSAQLSKATLMLFHIAAHSHVLAEQFGVELQDDGYAIKILNPVDRPWLVKSYRGGDEYTFDPDIYARGVDCCSTYTRHMRLWILNVWNPAAAKSKGWTFDLFAAMGGLDQGNREAIAWHLKHNIFP